MDQVTTVAGQPLCAYEEGPYKKIIRRLPEGASSIAASFFQWPPSDDYLCSSKDPFLELELQSVARCLRCTIPQPPQKSVCFAATFLSQYLADKLGPNTSDSPFAFAFAGAIALLALGISERPTSGLDIVFDGDSNALIAHLVQSSRFVLPCGLGLRDQIFQFFLKVGPGQGDETLAQDDAIWVGINYGANASRPFRLRCLERTMRYHDTALNVRSLNPFALLKNKLRMYASFNRRHDWLDICDIVESSADWIDLDRLETDAVRAFFEDPPDGLIGPEEWYNRYKARKAMWTQLGSPLGFLWLP